MEKRIIRIENRNELDRNASIIRIIIIVCFVTVWESVARDNTRIAI